MGVGIISLPLRTGDDLWAPSGPGSSTDWSLRLDLRRRGIHGYNTSAGSNFEPATFQGPARGQDGCRGGLDTEGPAVLRPRPRPPRHAPGPRPAGRRPGPGGAHHHLPLPHHHAPAGGGHAARPDRRRLWYKSMWPKVGLEDTQVRITISTLVLLVIIFTLDLNFRTVNGQEKESTSRGALYAGGHLH